MKILDVNQLRKLDTYTIEHEPIKSADLMERAARAFVERFISLLPTPKTVLVCCGTGNNGGDGLAVARLLSEKGYDTEVVIAGDPEKSSPDFAANLQKLPIPYTLFGADLPPAEVIIDALFGSGLSRPVAGLHAEVVERINGAEAVKVAVDIPSGLFADKVSGGQHIVRADFTITFQLPKLAFMLPQSDPFVGEWELADIGLSPRFISGAATDHYWTDRELVRSLIKRPGRFDHKGTNGHGLLIAGSFGKMGAAVLAGRAAVRSGLGLLTMQIPKSGNTIVQCSVPEAMTVPDLCKNIVSQYCWQKKYNALGIGPGIGTAPPTVKMVTKWLKQAPAPMVIDADALNAIAQNRTLLALIPEGSILTPHPKEFERLLGTPWADDFDRLKKQKAFASQYRNVVVLKGAHTAVALPDGRVYFNATGNPGMAKGGSGDVLTGILLSLLAQGYGSREAALLGVWLHGFAGDLAAGTKGQIAMSASDIIDYISEGYRRVSS